MSGTVLREAGSRCRKPHSAADLRQQQMQSSQPSQLPPPIMSHPVTLGLNQSLVQTPPLQCPPPIMTTLPPEMPQPPLHYNHPLGHSFGPPSEPVISQPPPSVAFSHAPTMTSSSIPPPGIHQPPPGLTLQQPINLPVTSHPPPVLSQPPPQRLDVSFPPPPPQSSVAFHLPDSSLPPPGTMVPAPTFPPPPTASQPPPSMEEDKQNPLWWKDALNKAKSIATNLGVSEDQPHSDRSDKGTYSCS